eukprot:Phypoly_transcript_06920.p1 GENE.Phypoly_transcript_06920~~Phypoly_transcript_06920.p1  ORF type:complete len:569 (+),score=84.53 Phypoly_transcript_06920:34-1707(+)
MTTLLASPSCVCSLVRARASSYAATKARFSSRALAKPGRSNGGGKSGSGSSVVLRPDVNKRKIALPNMTEVQMMFDTLMNPVPLKESTAGVDLKNMSSNIDEFFTTRPRNLQNFELYLNLLAFKGEYKMAIETLKLIEDLGYPQTKKAFNYVMLACANASLPDEAQSVFTKAVQVLGKKNISEHLYTTLAYAYAKVGRIDAVWDIITTVERDTLLKTDAVLYTVMIQSCVNHGDSTRAWHVYWHMQERGVPADQITYTQMIKLCAKTDMVERAINFYDEIISKKLIPTEEVYVSLIHACAGRKDLYNYNKAFEFFLKMKEDGFHPTMSTYTSLLLNSANRGDYETMEMIFDEMLANEERMGGLDSQCYTVLIDGYSHAISHNSEDKQHSYLLIAKGEIIFKKLQDRKVPVTNIMMNVMLKLYTEALDEKGALNVLENRFKQFDAVPDVHTYAALIKMYCNLGEVEQAQEMYQRLRDTGVVPPYWVYKILVRGCVKSKYFKRAIKFMREMRQHGIPPHIQDFKLFRRVTEKEFPELHQEIADLCDWSFPGTQYHTRMW